MNSSIEGLGQNNSRSIITKHVSNYIDLVSKTLVFTEVAILITELFIYIFFQLGYFKYQINVPGSNKTVQDYFSEKLFHKIIVWLSLFIYFLIYSKIGVKKRKTLLCIESFILTSILAFGCWNVNYFGFAFIVPIVIACPLGEKIHRKVLITSLLLIFIYSIMQTIINNDKYNYVIGVVAITSTISFFVISKMIYKSMFNAMVDLKNYASLSKELYNEIAHDYLTNAFSVTALNEDLNNTDYEFNSIAFLDLDNFKSINDIKGHDIGDKILKLIVSNVQDAKERIYRYGGDEFVILSKLNATSLKNKLEIIKQEFSEESDDLYSYKATLSIGIKKINDSSQNLLELLKDCDNLMYKSKKNGKNKITIEE